MWHKSYTQLKVKHKLFSRESILDEKLRKEQWNDRKIAQNWVASIEKHRELSNFLLHEHKLKEAQ